MSLTSCGNCVATGCPPTWTVVSNWPGGGGVSAWCDRSHHADTIQLQSLQWAADSIFSATVMSRYLTSKLSVQIRNSWKKERWCQISTHGMWVILSWGIRIWIRREKVDPKWIDISQEVSGGKCVFHNLGEPNISFLEFSWMQLLSGLNTV